MHPEYEMDFLRTRLDVDVGDIDYLFVYRRAHLDNRCYWWCRPTLARYDRTIVKKTPIESLLSQLNTCELRHNDMAYSCLLISNRN